MAGFATTINPIISVIVPVYNAEHTLTRCVESILSQTFKDFELILVDDGSKDNSGQICDTYAELDSRIRVIHQSNAGAAAARNSALDIARGEYLAFADSDDSVRSKWLESYIDNIGDFDLCFQGLNIIYADGTNKEMVHKAMDCIGIENIRNELTEIMSKHYLGFLVVKLLKRSIIEKWHIRINPKLKFREDEAFFCAYLEHVNSIKFIESVGYDYYYPACVNSKYDDPQMADCLIDIFRSLKVIYDYNIPYPVYESQLWAVEMIGLNPLLDNKIPSGEAIWIYKDCAKKSPETGISKKVKDFLVINSPKLKWLSIAALKSIHYILAKRRK